VSEPRVEKRPLSGSLELSGYDREEVESSHQGWAAIVPVELPPSDALQGIDVAKAALVESTLNFNWDR